MATRSVRRRRRGRRRRPGNARASRRSRAPTPRSAARRSAARARAPASAPARDRPRGSRRRVPRIARGSRREVCELGGDGLAEHDRAGRLRGAYHGRALLRDAAFEQRTAVLRRETRRVEDVLHTDGDALEATHRRTAAPALVRRCREPLRTLLVEPRERVDGRLGLRVPPQGALDEPRAAQLAARKAVSERDDVKVGGTHVRRNSAPVSVWWRRSSRAW